MNTSMRIGSGNPKPESIARKRHLRGPRGIYFCVLLALAFVLAPEYSPGQLSTKPCPPESADPPPGMVAWWPMRETSGPKIYDISGKGNNGTATPGAVGSGSPNWGPQPGPGMVGNALLFFFHNYARVNNSPSLNFGTTGSFSIDAWIKGGAGPILGNLSPAPSIRGYAFSVANNRLKLEMGEGGPNVTTWIGPKITPNVWNFVAVVVNRSPLDRRVRFYTASASSTLPLPLFVSATQIPPPVDAYSGLPLDIGKCPGNPNGCMTIDELEIYDRAISPGAFNGIFKAKSKGKCVHIARPPRDVPE